MIHEEAFLFADAVGERIIHGPRQRIGFHPFAAFPVAAARGHFADIDFRVKIRGKGLAVIARVAVDDIQHMHFVQLVLENPRGKDIRHAGIETGTEQRGQTGLAEAVLIGPLPLVFKLGGIQRLVVGRIKIMHAALEAGVHDVQILIGQSNVGHHGGFDIADKLAQLGHIVGIHLRRGNLHAVAALHARGDVFAAFQGAAGKGNFAESPFISGGLRHLVGHDATDAARADNQNILGHGVHSLFSCMFREARRAVRQSRRSR